MTLQDVYIYLVRTDTVFKSILAASGMIIAEAAMYACQKSSIVW